MKSLRDIRSARSTTGAWRKAGQRIALVPTMGNLHDGHIALVTRACREADAVIASVFVNPTQFGPSEDYAAYPRTLAADVRRLRAAGASAVFAPSVSAIYPRTNSTIVSVPLLSRELCGAFRPGHFDGVTSVVLRLLNIVAPDVAIFGEKDYQQLTILRRMVADLHLPIRIVGAPTVREPDGLAMSSRNQYLSETERRAAPVLHATLRHCRERLLAGERQFRQIESQAVGTLRRAGFRPDYVAVRDERELGMPDRSSRNLRVLAAAWLGKARLIDNVAVRLR